MHSSSQHIQEIFLVFCIGLVAVSSATYDPAFYLRSTDGSYRYGSSGGFSAANEGIGQYAQLQPDGRIYNVRYKARLGGFQPQYGAASAPYGRAAFGVDDSSGGQGRGPYSDETVSSGPFGNRPSNGDLAYDARPFNTAPASVDSSLNGGYDEAHSPAERFYGGGISPGSIRDRHNGGESLGPRSSFSRSPIGGSLGIAHNSDATQGSGLSHAPSFGSRTQLGSGPLGRPYMGTGIAAPYYGGLPYPGSRNPVIPVYSGNWNLQRQPSFPNTSSQRSVFTNTSPVSSLTTGSPGDGSYRAPYDNNNPKSSASVAHSGDVRKISSPHNNAADRDFSFVTAQRALNNLSQTVASSTTTSDPNLVNQTGSKDGGASNFAYRAPDSTRQESTDNQGNVPGSYSVRNGNGMSFVADSGTGFHSTGGSAAVSNDLGQRSPSLASFANKPLGTQTRTGIQSGNPSDQTFKSEPVSVRSSLGNADSGRSTHTLVSNVNENMLSDSDQRATSVLNPHQNGGDVWQGVGGAKELDNHYSSGDSGFGAVENNLANTNRPPGVFGSPGGARSHSLHPTTSAVNSFANGQPRMHGASGSFNRGNGGGFDSGVPLFNSNRTSGGDGQGSYNLPYSTGSKFHQGSSGGSDSVNGRYSYHNYERQIRPGMTLKQTGENVATKNRK